MDVCVVVGVGVVWGIVFFIVWVLSWLRCSQGFGVVMALSSCECCFDIGVFIV